MPASPAACAAETEVVPLASALLTPHLGRPDAPKEGIVWDARFIVDVDAAFDFRGGRIPFAVPLPPGEVLRPAAGIAPVVEADRVVGLCVSREAIHDRTILASFVQPDRPSESSALGAPVAAGSTVQVIDATSMAEARLEVHAGDLLEKHVGYVAPRGIGHGAREEARRLTDLRLSVSSSPVYVRGDDVRAAGGLTGRLVDPRARAKGSAFAVGVIFAAMVGGLVLLARRLRHHASVERADALLASEIEAIAKERV